MSPSLLPVELVRMIVSNLQCNIPTIKSPWGLYDGGEPQLALAACSLVSHSWRDIAQPILFENPVVMLENTHDRTGKTWAEFEDFIEAPSSQRLAKNIGTLTIMPYPRTNISATVPSPPFRLLDTYTLLSLISKLPKLTRLFLCNVTFDIFIPGPSNRPQQFPAQYANLEQLYISSRVCFATFAIDDLWLLVGAFSHLTILALRCMQFLCRSDAPKLALQRKLKHFSLFDCGLGNISLLRALKLAMTQQRLPMLTSLSVGRIFRMPVLQGVLDVIGGQLTSLALQQLHQDHALRFLPCPNLASLSLRMHPERQTPSERNVLWDFALRSFEDPSHFPSLAALTFECLDDPFLPNECNVHLDAERAERLSSALSAFPALKTVTFKSSEPEFPYRAVEREHLSSMLAGLGAKGLLVIV